MRDKVQNGKINTEIEIYFNEKNLLDNFIARGSVTNLSAQIYENIILKKLHLLFLQIKLMFFLKKFIVKVVHLK